MNTKEVLDLFDRQLRREYPGDAPDDLMERLDGIVRQTSTHDGWAGVIWSDLDETTADAAIAEQVRHYTGLGREFEWKLYAHDRPADLGARLTAAGFAAQDPETLMVAEAAGLPVDPNPPEGIELRPVTDKAGVELMMEVHELAFGRPSPWLGRHLTAQLERDPDSLCAVLALAGGRPVSAARIEFHEGTEFASLWGGGTVAEWRGRGIYKATVAFRTAIALDRGYRYLQVDASDQSRPILERLGFQPLTTTTPYEYKP